MTVTVRMIRRTRPPPSPPSQLLLVNFGENAFSKSFLLLRGRFKCSFIERRTLQKLPLVRRPRHNFDLTVGAK